MSVRSALGFITVLGAVAALAVLPAPANAARYKRCGSAGRLYSGQLTLANVRARHISCRKARRFARRFTLRSGPETGFRCAEDFYCTWRGWSCRNDGRSGTVIKHRCETVNTRTRKVMVIRWIDR